MCKIRPFCTLPKGFVEVRLQTLSSTRANTCETSPIVPFLKKLRVFH